MKIKSKTRIGIGGKTVNHKICMDDSTLFVCTCAIVGTVAVKAIDGISCIAVDVIDGVNERKAIKLQDKLDAKREKSRR